MLNSNYITYQLFDETELSRLNLLFNKFEEDDWVDGLESTSHSFKEIKNNKELGNKKYKKPIDNILNENLSKNDAYVNYTVPLVKTSTLISKTTVGGYYNLHQDAHTLGNFSTTVFMSDPHEYEGGELCLYFDNKNNLFKLQKGYAITYETGIPHKVNKVVKGDRIALIFWTTSTFEDNHIRSIYYKLNVLKNIISKDKSPIVYDFTDIDKNPSYIINDIKNILQQKFSKRK
jgi:PKHD-type hydroxylase